MASGPGVPKPDKGPHEGRQVGRRKFPKAAPIVPALSFSNYGRAMEGRNRPLTQSPMRDTPDAPLNEYGGRMSAGRMVPPKPTGGTNYKKPLY